MLLLFASSKTSKCFVLHALHRRALALNDSIWVVQLSDWANFSLNYMFQIDFGIMFEFRVGRQNNIWTFFNLYFRNKYTVYDSTLFSFHFFSSCFFLLLSAYFSDYFSWFLFPSPNFPILFFNSNICKWLFLLQNSFWKKV